MNRTRRPALAFLLVALVLSAMAPFAQASPAPAHQSTARAQAFASAALTSLAGDRPVGLVQPEVSRSSYESPLGFSVEWPRGWDLDDYIALPGGDIVWLERDDVSVQLWGLMQFGGEPDTCLDFLTLFYEESFGFGDLDPSRDAVDEPISGPARSTEYAVFEVDGDAELYLSCQTMVRDESVFGLAVLAPAGDLDDALAETEELIDDGVSLPDSTVERDEDAFQATLDELGEGVDDFYGPVLRREGERYEAPDYLGFNGPTETPCYTSEPMPGLSDDEARTITAGQGPVYCGLDTSVYMDQAWLETYVVPVGGDLSLALILAHETGHHVQDLTGWSRDYDYSDSRDEFIVEQQADCLSGAYLRSAIRRGIFDERDLEIADELFDAIGGTEPGEDHGTGEERYDAFMDGYDRGVSACDLFTA